MTRTLVISDLHLGCRVRSSVLTRPPALELLLAALDGVDRLVLLGDAVELVEAPPTGSLAVARPILRAIGARLGRDREVIIVPGNHDHALVRAWIRAHGAELRTETAVPLDATPAMADLTTALAAGESDVRVSYPGVWLTDRVWATHGHYLDLHLLPTSAHGLLRRSPPREHAVPLDYELSRRRQLSRAARWLPRPLAALLDDAAELARASTMPRIRRRVLNKRWAPLTAALLGLQMRRHSLPALSQVVQRLGVDAGSVVFGHVHRLGPLPDDDPADWAGVGGGPNLVNTGSWLYEPLLVHLQAPPHPYWPGGAVLLEDGAEPRAVALLDSLSESDLRRG